MKNKKRKILLLLSTVLLLMLGNTVLGATDNYAKGCPSYIATGNHNLQIQLEHTFEGQGVAKEVKQCLSCRYQEYTGSFEFNHNKQVSYECIDDDKHKCITNCTSCTYKKISEARHNFSEENICTACNYTKVTTTTPTISTGKCSHVYMRVDGYKYEKFNDTMHKKISLKKCMKCGEESIRATIKEEHDWKIVLYEKKNDSQHKTTYKCSKCSAQKEGLDVHTYGEDGICIAEGCGNKKSTTTKSLLKVSYLALCVDQTASCYALTDHKSGISWKITEGDAVTLNGSSLKGVKAGSVTLEGSKDGVTSSCKITVFDKHLISEVKYGYNDTQHWEIGKCTRCNKQITKGNAQSHTFSADTKFIGNANGHYQAGVCLVCGEEVKSKATAHTFIVKMKYDDEFHWYTGNCSVCGYYCTEYQKVKHEFGDDGKCSKCDIAQNDSTVWPESIYIGTWDKICLNCVIKSSDLWLSTDPYNASQDGITLSSSDTSVLYIQENTAKPKAKGTAYLIATAPNGVSGKSGVITVTDHEFNESDNKCKYCKKSSQEIDSAEVPSATSQIMICEGKNISSSIAVGTGVNSAKIIYSSSNPNVLAVTSEGMATPTDKYQGAVTVYAKVDGVTVGSCVVNVHVATNKVARYNQYTHYYKTTCSQCGKNELIRIDTVEEHKFGSDNKCTVCPWAKGGTGVSTEISFKRTEALLCVEHCKLDTKVECVMVAIPEVSPAGAELTWSSSDTSIVEVIDNTYVVAKKKGKAWLTAKTSDGLTATCDIEVVDHDKAVEMEYNYNGKYHWRYGICGKSLGDIYNAKNDEHDFTNGVCKCGKKAVGGENNPIGYVDVKKGDWYEKSVDYVTEKELMNGIGEGLFNPNGSMTRAMVVTVLYRMSGSNFTGKPSFSDVGEDEYYSTPVAWASENGIVTGFPNGTFAPNDEVTREQLITILYRYTQFLGSDTEVSSSSSKIDEFVDYEDIADYAVDAFEWSFDEGIVSGTSETTLEPKGTATRGQFSAILERFDILD